MSLHDAAKRSAAEALDRLDRTLAHLDGAPKAEDRWVRLDAVAKRFESAFERVWAAFKASARWQGTDAPGPRPAIQAAARYGWIDAPEDWAEYLDARDVGAHAYDSVSPEDYAVVARRFAVSARRAIGKLP